MFRVDIVLRTAVIRLVGLLSLLHFPRVLSHSVYPML